jgi:hypothetical protein
MDMTPGNQNALPPIEWHLVVERGQPMRAPVGACENDAQPSDPADRFTAGLRPLFRGC